MEKMGGGEAYSSILPFLLVFFPFFRNDTFLLL
jgi:hypothetical protein